MSNINVQFSRPTTTNTHSVVDIYCLFASQIEKSVRARAPPLARCARTVKTTAANIEERPTKLNTPADYFRYLTFSTLLSPNEWMKMNERGGESLRPGPVTLEYEIFN